MKYGIKEKIATAIRIINFPALIFWAFIFALTDTIKDIQEEKKQYDNNNIEELKKMIKDDIARDL